MRTTTPEEFLMEVRRREDARQTLDLAAMIVDDVGLAKHTSEDEGRVCATFAINLAARELHTSYDDATVLLRGSLGMKPWGSIANWNDRWIRTKGQVVRALRRAAR